MKRIAVNHGWQFRSIKDQSNGAAWQPVTLPHDAMIHESRDPHTANGYNTGYYPGGTYEYRMTIELTTPAPSPTPNFGPQIRLHSTPHAPNCTTQTAPCSTPMPSVLVSAR